MKFSDGYQAGNRLARYELAERGDTVSEDLLPDTIYVYKGGEWLDRPVPMFRDSEYVFEFEKYIRAARGDEPGEAAERIAQLEADLEAADEEARKLREIICDAWRKDALSDESGEWLPVEDGIIELDRMDCVEAAGNNLIVYDRSTETLVSLPDDIRLCRRVAEPSSEAKTLESANEYIAELEREIMDLKGMMDTHPYAVLPDEDAQILELVRLMQEDYQEQDNLSSTYRFGIIITRDGVRAMCKGELYTVTDAITELRSRNPEPPQRPTKADADRLIDRLGIYLRGAIDKGDGFAIPLKIDVDDYLKRNEENRGEDSE